MFDIKKHKLGVFSPSSYISAENLDAGCRALEAAGFRLEIHPQALARIPNTQIAGTDKEKLQAFIDLLQNPDVGAIMATCGGNRALNLLPELVGILVDNNPKPLIGISDFSAILNNTSKTGIFGPVVNWCGKHQDALTPQYVQQLLSLMNGQVTEFSMRGGSTVRSGGCEGIAYGGTQSVFQALMGTPYFPDLDNAILFLEDVGEELSRIDRLFATLRLSGALDRISGLVCGQFLNCLDTGRPFGYDLVDIIEFYCSHLTIPIVINAPFGHGSDLAPFPIGRKIKLQISQCGDVKIETL